MDYQFIKSHRILEKALIKYWLKTQKGEYNSKSLRNYFELCYKIKAGLYSYGWSNPNLNFGGGLITIGNYCSIASKVVRLGANHPIKMLSMHPYFYNPALGFGVRDVERNGLNIGHGVWIGYNVLILPGCTSIGNGAVIGAGAIVTHDVEPYSIVGGNPASKIKMRFEEGFIEMIEKTQWWNYSPEKLIKYYDKFLDIQALYNEWITN